MSPEVARRRIERLRSRSPAAVELAALCSLAVRVEPELLRRLRLLLPGADVSAESDLWSSDLLAGRSVSGIAIEPEVADVLRAELAQSRWDDLRPAALDTISASHADLHWSLRLEEQAVQAATGFRPDSSDADALFRAAIGALRASSGRPPQQVGIARWLGTTRPRTAQSARSGQVVAAELAANLVLGKPIPANLDRRTAAVWLPFLLSEPATTDSIAVRFGDGRLEFGATGPDAVTLAVPAMQPITLDVSWVQDGAGISRRLSLRRADKLVLPVAAAEVELGLLTGRRYRLRAGGPAGEPVAGGYDFRAERQRHRPALGLAVLLDDLQRFMTGPGAVLELSGPAGSGKTVLACALADRLETAGVPVVSHFFAVAEGWNSPDLIAASLLAQLNPQVPPKVRDRQPTPRSNPADRLVALHRSVPQLTAVVLLDGFPNDDPAQRRFVSALMSSGIRVIVTGRTLLPASSSRRVSAEDYGPSVCEAMYQQLLQNGRSDLPPSELQALAGGNPRRMRMIGDWLMAHPGEPLERVPPTLTTRFAGIVSELVDRYGPNAETFLAAVAVAGAGLTLADLAAAIPVEIAAELVPAGADAGLIRPVPFPVGPTTRLEPTPALAAGLQELRGDELLVEGHGAIAVALFGYDGGAISPYLTGNAARHVLAARASSMVAPLDSVVASGPFLHVRAAQDGVDAAVADLKLLLPAADVRLLAAQAVREVARSRPQAFVGLIANELRRMGQAEATVGRFLMGSWPPPLAVRAVQRPTEPTLADAAVDAVAGDNGVAATTDGIAWFNGDHVVEQTLGGWPAQPIAFAADARDSIVAEPDTGYTTLMIHNRRTRQQVTKVIDGRVVKLRMLGELIGVGNADGVVRLLGRDGDSPTLARLVGHSGEILDIVPVSANLVVTTSRDCTVRIWSLSDYRQVSRHQLQAPAVAIAAMDSGDWLTADADGRLQWWDDHGTKVGAELSHPVPIERLQATALGVFCFDSAGGISFLQPASMQSLTRVARTWRTSGPRILQTTVAAGMLVTLDEHGVLSWWQYSPGEPAQVQFGPVSTAFSLSAVQDGETGSSDEAGHSSTASDSSSTARVLVTLVSRDRIEVRPLGYTSPVADQRPLLSVSNRGALAVATPLGIAVVDTFGHGAWSVVRPDVVGLRGLGSVNGELVFLDATGRLRAASRPPGWPRGDVELIHSSLDQLVTAESDGTVTLLAGSEVTNFRHRGGRITALANLGAGYVAVGDDRGQVRLLNDRLIDDGVRECGQLPITAIDSTDRWLVVGAADGTVYRCNLGTNSVSVLGRHDGAVTAIVDAGDRCLTASADRTIRLWDTARGLELDLVAGPSPFEALVASPEAGRYYAAAADGTVWMFDDTLSNQEPLISAIRPADGPRAIELDPEDPAAIMVRLRLSVDVPVELRRVQVSVIDASAGVPGSSSPLPLAQAWELLRPGPGRAGFAPELLGEDGTLLRPWRLPPAESWLGLRGVLAAAGQSPPGPLQVTLTVATAARPDGFPVQVALLEDTVLATTVDSTETSFIPLDRDEASPA